MERYGVFKRFPNGSRLWACPANDLTGAKPTMLDLAAKTGNEHFIHDFVLGQSVATSIESKAAGGSATK